MQRAIILALLLFFQNSQAGRRRFDPGRPLQNFSSKPRPGVILKFHGFGGKSEKKDSSKPSPNSLTEPETA
jgi:hypothetical protein